MSRINLYRKHSRLTGFNRGDFLMILIEQKIMEAKSLDGLEKDTVVLNWEDRNRSRLRLTTAKGIEIGIALPTGTGMQDGDILYLDDSRYIVVEAAKDDVIVIYPEDMTGAAFAAYEIGNRHLPVSINRDGIMMTPYNRLLEDLLKKESVRYKCTRDVFEPIKKAHSHG